METTFVLNGMRDLLKVSAVVAVLVLVAMCTDLASGWVKAKQRGEARTSYGLSRSLSKFLQYEGGVIVATCIDLMMHFCRFWQFAGMELFRGVPIVTCLIGIYLCTVEIMSLRERADEKVRRHMDDAGKVLGAVIASDKIIDAIGGVVAERLGVVAKPQHTEREAEQLTTDN